METFHQEMIVGGQDDFENIQENQIFSRITLESADSSE